MAKKRSKTNNDERSWDSLIEEAEYIIDEEILYLGAYFNKKLKPNDIGIFKKNAPTHLDIDTALHYRESDNKNYLYVIYNNTKINGLYMPDHGLSPFDETRIFLHSNQEWVIMYRDDDERIVMIELLTPEEAKEHKETIKTINNMVEESKPLEDNMIFFYWGFFDKSIKRKEKGEFKAPIRIAPTDDIWEEYLEDFPSNYFYTIVALQGTKLAPMIAEEEGLMFALPSHQKWLLMRRNDEEKKVKILLINEED